MMSYSFRLQQRLKNKYGPWAIITGASSGIGRAIALRLAEAELKPVLVARSSDQLDQLAQEIQDRFGIESQCITADLSAESGVQKVLDQTEKLEIGLLIASAGFGTSGHFHESPYEKEENMLQLNCHALMQLTHHFSRQMVQKKRGGIILISSITGFQGAPFITHYAATKAYVQSLAEGLYHELKPFNVDVLAASPGPVATGFGKRANMRMDKALEPEQVALPILEALGKQSTVFPGWLSKVLFHSMNIFPRPVKVQMMKKIMGKMAQGAS